MSKSVQIGPKSTPLLPYRPPRSATDLMLKIMKIPICDMTKKGFNFKVATNAMYK